MLTFIAFALGVGTTIGLREWPFALVFVSALILAAGQLWHSRSLLKKLSEDAWDGRSTGAGPTAGVAMIYAGTAGLFVMVIGAGYLAGSGLRLISN
jgi:hypothetical protein